MLYHAGIGLLWVCGVGQEWDMLRLNGSKTDWGSTSALWQTLEPIFET